MNEEKYFEMPLKEEPEVIIIKQAEGWKFAKSPEIIETSGMGPCVGIIIYDKVSKQAMAAHLEDPKAEDLSGMLDEAIQKFSATASLKIYIGGGGPGSNSPSDINHNKETKEFVKEQLDSHGFKESQIEYRWLKFSDQSAVMRIDTATGKFDFDVDDFTGFEGYE